MILYVIFVSGEMIGAHLARNEQKTLLNAAGNGSTGPNCFLHFSILCIVVRTRDTVANQNTYTNSFRFFLEFPCVFATPDRSLQAKFLSNFTSTKFQNVLYNARNIFVKSVSRSVRILSRTTVHCRRYNCDTKKDLPCTRVTIPRLDRIYKFTCL